MEERLVCSCLNRVAVISMIVENPAAAEELNGILHQYRDYIVGRMGIPHVRENVSVICTVLDAPQNIIAALSGKLGNIPDVSVKTAYSK